MLASPNLSVEPWNPTDLVARIRRGDRAAGAELVARYSRGIAVILRRTAPTHPGVEDLHQDVFLLAMEKIRAGELRDPERLSGFLCALARNLAIDYLRRPSSASPAAGDEERESIPDREDGPLERILRIEASVRSAR